MRDGCAFTSRLFTFPFLAIQRKWPAIIGIVAPTRKAKKRTATPPLGSFSPWANDRVISANQIGDCLTPEQQRDRREAEGAHQGPICSRGERKDALICISKSNAREPPCRFPSSRDLSFRLGLLLAFYYRRSETVFPIITVSAVWDDQ